MKKFIVLKFCFKTGLKCVYFCVCCQAHHIGGGSVVVDLFIATPIVGVCNSSMFCWSFLNVDSSFAIILLVALLSLSSWCLVIVVWLFLVVPWVCLQFVIVVFPDHTHLLFLTVGFLSLRYLVVCTVESLLCFISFFILIYMY